MKKPKSLFWLNIEASRFYNWFVLVSFLFLSHYQIQSQTILEANGPGDTYEEISEVLAPGYNPIEVPDCGHTDFGRHIDEIFDSELNQYVFRFHLHTSPDDDRCLHFDRQRNEIKTYDKSPDALLAFIEDSVEYKWKFKLDSNFQPSTRFTHLHQIKAVGGSESSMPLITLTPRKSSPDKLQLRYADTFTQTTIYETDLDPFLGHWLEASENISYDEVGLGKYELNIVRVDTDEVLFHYENNEIRTWKTDAEFLRPKWGVYRSLEDSTNLRDEQVLFADISIEKITVDPCSAFDNGCKGDFNNDGNISALDLATFLAVFSTSCGQ